MSLPLDAAARERLVSFLQIQPGFDPQADDLLTFDFADAEEAFEAVQREATTWANRFNSA